MSEKPYCPVMSNHISVEFPELSDFILENYHQQISLKAGETLPAGSPNEILYITEGSIKSYICDENGDERLMYILLSDTIVFGAVDTYFLKTFVVQEAAKGFLISHQKVLEFIQKDTMYIRSYIRICNSRYGILLQQMLSINHCSAKHKVFSFILQVAQKYGEADAATGNIIITKFPSITDIASITGVHRSNTNSYISELREQNIVTKEKNNFIIHDIALLKKIITSLDCHEN